MSFLSGDLVQVANEGESGWPRGIISWSVANLVIYLKNGENQGHKTSIKGVSSIIKRHDGSHFDYTDLKKKLCENSDVHTRAAGFDK